MLMPEEHDPRRDGGVDFRPAAADHMGHIMEVTGTEASHGGYRAIYVHGLQEISGDGICESRWAGAAAPVLLTLLCPAADPPKPPLGLIPVIWPQDNPYTPEKAELGRYLYFDKRLSADGSVSCATCHDPTHGFTDGAPVSTGIKGQQGNRSAPTVINRAYSLAQFWDGRAATLEEQAKGPIANPIEMGNTHDAMVISLRKIQGYRSDVREGVRVGAKSPSTAWPRRSPLSSARSSPATRPTIATRRATRKR